MNPAKTRILLADDHVMVRAGLRRLIEAEPDMEVVGEAGDGGEAVSRTLELQPDIVVMDVSMHPVGGPMATRDILRQCPDTKVLGLTVHEDKGYAEEMLDAGASGYVLKRAAADELISAIRRLAAGEIHVDERVASKLLAGLGPNRGRSVPTRTQLSERETEVMRYIAQGFTNKEISAKLAVSVKTIETYKARSMEKLGLKSRVDIIRLAGLRGWLAT